MVKTVYTDVEIQVCQIVVCHGFSYTISV